EFARAGGARALQHALGEVEGVHVSDIGGNRPREASDAAADLDHDVVASGYIANGLADVAPDAMTGVPEFREIAVVVRAVAGDVPVWVLRSLRIPKLAAVFEAP